MPLVRRAVTALGVVLGASALLFCSVDGERSPEVAARASWLATMRTPRVASLAQGVDRDTVRHDKGTFFVAEDRRDSGVEARLAATADGRFDLVVRHGAEPLHVNRVAALKSEGVIVGGAVVYRDAWPDADVAVFRRASTIEELVTVRRQDTRIAYDVALHEGWHIVILAPGVLEVRDADGRAQARMRADRAWDANGAPIATRVMANGAHIEIGLAGWGPRPVVIDPSWEQAGAGLVHARASHTATPLTDGTVLIVGGDDGATALASAESYDPEANLFRVLPAFLTTPRKDHTATPLMDGRVLVAGGRDSAGAPLRSLEVYNPTTRSFTPVGAMGTARFGHTASRLHDGTVLLVGGNGGVANVASDAAEIFDPTNGRVTAVGPLTFARAHHTATTLPDGRVVIGGGGPHAEVEIYDPSVGAFALGPALQTPRSDHVAIYDPLASGFVLFIAGIGIDGQILDTVEPFDLGANAIITEPSTFAPRRYAAALALPNHAFLIGGESFFATGAPDAAADAAPPIHYATTTVSSIALVASEHTFAPWLQQGRKRHTVTALRDGSLLVVGGATQSSLDPTEAPDLLLSSAERYLPDHTAVAYTGSMTHPRSLHTSTLLPNGRVLVTGGTSLGPADSAEIYDPKTGAFTSTTQSMRDARSSHTATLLPDGRVLLVGGKPEAGADIFDSTTGRFLPVSGSVGARCEGQTTTLLTDGTALVAGGHCDVAASSAAFVIDPRPGDGQGGVARPTAKLHSVRQYHAAVRLLDGRVLIVGGSGGDALGAEIYDASTKTFTQVSGSLRRPRNSPSATLLDDGSVLIAGGENPGTGEKLQSTEIMHLKGAGSIEATFELGGDMRIARGRHTVTPLPDGRLAFIGGDYPGAGAAGAAFKSQVEIFDRRRRQFDLATTNGTPVTIRGTGQGHAATLLASGDILITGGTDAFAIDAAERLSLRSAPSDDYASSLEAIATPVQGGTAIVLRGTAIAGAVDRSGGTTNSSSGGVPQATWLPLTGGLPARGGVTAWSSTRAAWLAPVSPFPGPGLLFLTVDGVQGAGTFVTVTAATSGSPCASANECEKGFCVDGVCCDQKCDAPCMACSASAKSSGANGVCGAIATGGSDPACPTEPSSSCGTTGTCNEGKCASYSDGTPCGPGGLATCRSAACVATRCGSNAECPSGSICRAGACALFETLPDPDANGCVASPIRRRTTTALWVVAGAILIGAARRRRSRKQ